jgi:NADH:ubiquinone oxidoreductase subunit 6 (subunit J)
MAAYDLFNSLPTATTVAEATAGSMAAICLFLMHQIRKGKKTNPNFGRVSFTLYSVALIGAIVTSPYKMPYSIAALLIFSGMFAGIFGIEWINREINR